MLKFTFSSSPAQPQSVYNGAVSNVLGELPGSCRGSGFRRLIANQERPGKSMKWIRFISAGAIVVFGSSVFAADGQFRGAALRKQPIEVRLIALAIAYPRSSVFANDEVFVAEQELASDESRFIKLVYDFLPYQSPLSESGLDYSLIHRFHAVRDTTCDENLWQMRWLFEQHSPNAPSNSEWKYSAESPVVDLDRRQARLRCYRATSDDYEKPQRSPASEASY